MKKLFSILMICLSMMVGMTSCKTTQFGLVYNVAVTGEGDGDFKVTFDQGAFAMNGAAQIALQVGDTVPFNKVMTKEEVMNSKDKKVQEAARMVNASIAATTTEGTGTYDITIHGQIKEMGTGIAFNVDRRITNRENAPMRSVSVSDPYPFLQ